MTRALAALLAAALLVRGPARAEPCPSAEAAGQADEKLDHLSAAIRKRGPIELLAFGSPSAAGADAPAAPGSFPAQVAAAMRAALPDVEVRLTAVGGRGQSAADMLPVLEQNLAGRHPTVVLWQTGTVEAVRGLPPDEFSDALGEAAGKVAEAGADLILIDPQYSRFLRANADVEPYEEVLRQTAALPSVLLFRRFDLMHAWVDEGSIDLERTPKAGREDAVRRLHQCLGEALARYVITGAAEPGPDENQEKPAR